MQYDPQFLDRTENLSEENKQILHSLSSRVPLNKFLSVPRNVEELGIDFIHSSAQIEGNTYSPVDTENLLKLGITAGSKPFTDAVMITNMRSAYDSILTAREKQNVYSKDYIKDLQYLLVDGLVGKSLVGVVRNQEVLITLTNYVPLKSSQSLDSEMTYMIEMLNKIESPFEAAIYAHLNICYLQYFIDCNKRTARFYQNAILIKNNLVPLLFGPDSISGYKESVVYYYETGDVSKYVDWFINSYKTLINKLDYTDPVIPARIFDK